MYCTIDDLIQRFGEDELIQRTDRDYDGSMDTAVIDAAIADATDQINAYLQGRVTLPLSDVPRIITAHACDIARYRLYDDGVSEHVAERHKQTMQYLRDVAAGRVKLPIQEETGTQAENVVIIQSRPSIFSRGGF